jgi:hypothetical protein
MSSHRRRSRPVVSATVAAFAVAMAGLALPGTGAHAASARPGQVTVTTAAKDRATVSLRRAKVKVSATRPASVKRSRWTMSVSGTPQIDATSLKLNGRLRFSRGKRSVTFSALRLSLGKKPAVSGKLGKRRITILKLKGAPKRDAAAGTISLEDARVSLDSAGVRTLRSRLKTSRVKAGRLGKATVTVNVASVAAPAPQPAPAPAPAPVPLIPPIVVEQPPAPPTPPAPTPQEPPVPCWTAPPSDATDWIACDRAIGGNLFGFVDYLIRGGGTVEPTADAESLDGPFNLRLTPLGTPTVEGGWTEIEHSGGIRYVKAIYGIDIDLHTFVVRVNAARTEARVHVDGSYSPRPTVATPAPSPVSLDDAEILTVNLAAARSNAPVVGGTVYELAPASLTTTGRAVWGDTYPIGSSFGAFTITVPDAVPAG